LFLLTVRLLVIIDFDNAYKLVCFKTVFFGKFDYLFSIIDYEKLTPYSQNKFY